MKLTRLFRAYGMTEDTAGPVHINPQHFIAVRLIDQGVCVETQTYTYRVKETLEEVSKIWLEAMQERQ